MATVLVITPARDYGQECFEVFRRHHLFPVVISTVDQALPLLQQFRADVIVVHCSSEADGALACARLGEHARDTPVIMMAELSLPQSLAARVRDALQALTTRAEQTADVSRASSSSREGWSV